MINRERWNEIVRTHPDATPFHLWEWGELNNWYKNEFLPLEGGGVFPLISIRSRIFGNRLVSVPYAEHGGPITESPDALKELFGTARREGHARGARYIELRDIPEKYAKVARECGFKLRQEYSTFEIELGHEDEYFISRMNRNTMRKIRAFETEKELQLEVASSKKDLEDFYVLYIDTLKRHGSPPHAYSFFLNMWELYAPLDILHIFFAVLGKKKIAAYLVFAMNQKIFAWASTVDHRFRELNPQTFLIWNYIRWGRGHGYHLLDLGRTRPQSPIFGAKSAWGGRERQLIDAYYFFGKPSSPPNPSQPLYKLAASLWRLLPVSIARRVGPPLASKIAL